MNRKAPNQVRIIGGSWRSRIIEFPDSTGLRPTPDRVRETVFNWLRQHLDGKMCLDLFAGSGALGFEALSRGAAEVVMVEQSSIVARGLKENAQLLGANNATVVNANAMQYLRGTARPFDVVFLSPWRAPDAKVYAESELNFAPSPDWKILKQSRAGQVKFQIMTPIRAEEI